MSLHAHSHTSSDVSDVWISPEGSDISQHPDTYLNVSSIIDTFYSWPLGGPVWREGLSQIISMINIRMINTQSFTLTSRQDIRQIFLAYQNT